MKHREERSKKSGADEKKFLQSEISRLTELLDRLSHENENLKSEVISAKCII